MSAPVHVAGHAAGLVAAGLVAVLGSAAPAAGAAKVTPGRTDGGDVVKTGWWWAANDAPAEGNGVVAQPRPSPPNVPRGSLPVAAAGGDPEKVSAIEFSLDAAPGSYLTSFDLVLRETDEPGASANQEMAGIVACPVEESFWADGTAASWQGRPEYDCDLGAAGVRGPDGVWHFDLTTVAAMWLTKGFSGSMSVALVEDVEAPESFQVTYDGPDDNGIGFRAVTAPPAAGPAAGSGASGAAGGAMSGPVAGLGPAASSGGTSAATDGSGLSGSPLSAPAVAAPPDAGADPAVAAPAEKGVAQVSSLPAAVPPWYSGIPGAGWLLFPLVLALAYLMMLALGPDAQPSGPGTRHGVSRALDRLRHAGSRGQVKGDG